MWSVSRRRSRPVWKRWQERELRRRVPAESWLECRCVPESHGSPLRPFVDLLSATAQPIEAILGHYRFDLTDSFPLFAALLSLPADDRYPAQPLTPDRQKELTLSAIVTLLLRMAEERPLVFVMEDLHWADLTTLELVELLVHEVQVAEVESTESGPRICVVLTARPTFTPTWPIEGSLLVPLSRLTRQEIEAIVLAGLAQSQTVGRDLLDRVVETSDGVPLFVEEVTRVLLEAGRTSEAAEPAGGQVGFEIPGTLRDVLTARLVA